MRRQNLAILFFLIAIPAFCQSNKTFSISDTVFEIGSVCKAENIFYSGFRLRSESNGEIFAIKEFLQANKKIKIEIGVHTDFRPIPITNDTLSQKVSEELLSYLVELGVEENRIIPKGYGSNQPFIVTKEINNKYDFLPVGQILDKNFILSLKSTEQIERAHMLNRRIEIKIISIE